MLRFSLMLLVSVFVGGCVSVPKDAGFRDVAGAVDSRIGQRVHWYGDTDADRQVRESIDRLLSRELGVDDAVQVALLNNENLQATYEDLGIAQAQLVEAGLLRNPTLSAEMRFPKSPKFPFEIDVVGDFIDLLMMPLRKRIAGAAFDVAKDRVADEVLRAAAEVKIAFYRAQGAAQLVEVNRTIVAADEASFEVARRLHDAGNINDLAFIEQRAMYEQSKADLQRAEAQSLDDRESLSALMGVAGKQLQWTMATRLPELPVSDDEIAPQTLETLALQQRFDLAAARHEMFRAAGSVEMTKSTALISSANLFVHVEGDPDGTVTSGPGLEVPIPIFNQGQPAIVAQRARFNQSVRKYRALGVQVLSEVRRARNALDAARQRQEQIAQVIVPLRHEIVEQRQLQYNAMQTSAFQLLAAKRDEIEVGRESVESLRDFWIAEAQLERAIGGRLPRDRTKPATQPGASTRPSEHEQHHHGDKP